MSDEEFWNFIDTLNANIKRFKFNSEKAVNEAVRSSLFTTCTLGWQQHSFGDDELKNWHLVAKISNKYQSLKFHLWEKADALRLEHFRGDDSMSDLIDSLPLAGKEVVNGIISGNIDSEKHFKEMIEPDLRKVVLSGENYIAQILEECLVRFFTTIAMQVK